LLPDESLPSYLTRLAAANCYEPHSILTTLCNKHLAALGIRDNLNHPRHPETFDLLSSLTQVSPGELANATIHRFSQAPILPRMDEQITRLSDGQAIQLLDTRTRSKKLRKDDHAQFCPDCLQEATYHHLSWFPLDVSVCLKHMCLLINRCYNCNTWISSRAIVAHRCRICGTDFVDTPPHYLRDKPFELFAQRTVQSWWGLVALLPTPLTWTMPAEPAPVLYRVLEGLTDSFRVKWEAKYFFRLINALPSSHVIQTTAFKGLVNWPQGFYDLLREYSQHTTSDVRYGHPASSKLTLWFSRWLSDVRSLPEFEFVQRAFDQFVLENAYVLDETVWRQRIVLRSDFASRFPLIPKRRAAQLLGTTSSIIETLALKGIVRSCDSGMSQRLWVSKEDVLNLQIRWTEGFTLPETAQLLGVSPDVVVSLADSGLLNAEHRSTVDKGAIQLFRSSTVEELWKKGITNVSNLGADVRASKYFDFATAVQFLSKLGVNEALLIGKVLEGKLWMCLHVDSDYPFRTLVFLREDLGRLADDIAAGKGWVRWEEIARKMGVKVYVVRRWIDSGLLKPISSYINTQYFDRKVAEGFITGHLYTREAAEILGVKTRMVHRWTQEGKLEPVSSRRIDRSGRNLYRRADIERLRSENH
jgi:DNA-binding transcriptional MerR regulator